MILEILISTYNEGILKVPDMILPFDERIKWLVCFQYSEEFFRRQIPSVLNNRGDVTLVTFKGKGLSKNRNMAIMCATGDILLLADDDARYKTDYFDKIIRRFSEDPTLDIACFQAMTHDGAPLHHYPDYSFDYRDTPKGYWYNSQEIAFRRISHVPSFDIRFGINSPELGCGEEEVFLWQAYKQGLSVRYFPEVITETDAKTSRYQFYTNKRMQRAKGAVLCIMHGPFGALLRCVKFAISHAVQHNPVPLLWQMIYGIIYIRR